MFNSNHFNGVIFDGPEHKHFIRSVVTQRLRSWVARLGRIQTSTRAFYVNPDYQGTYRQHNLKLVRDSYGPCVVRINGEELKIEADSHENLQTDIPEHSPTDKS